MQSRTRRLRESTVVVHSVINGRTSPGFFFVSQLTLPSYRVTSSAVIQVPLKVTPGLPSLHFPVLIFASIH
jgi:hypothetical protein